jgi:hypothetical protein
MEGPMRRTLAPWLGSRTANLVLMATAFLLSRALIFFIYLVVLPTSGDNDIRVYARYAHDSELAAQRGGTPYDYHAVEYPPLALAAMILPEWLVNQPSAAERLPPELFARYRVTFRVEMAVADLLGFLLVLYLVRRWFPDESPGQQSQRVLAYIFAGLALGTLVHTRLDMLLGTLMLASLALLLGRRHYLWSFFLLAVAVSYKFIPIALAPLWVIATLRPADLAGLWQWRALPRLLLTGLGRSAVLLGMIVGLFIPTYLYAGPRSLLFLTYHRERGLEIESFYGCYLLLARWFGGDAEVYVSHSSVNVRATGSDLLVALSPLIVGTLLLFATGWLCAVLVRRSGTTLPLAERPLGRQYRLIFVGFTALFLLLFIVGNKVFSPQYLLWVTPLLALLPLSGTRYRAYAAAFLIVCALSTVVVVLWSSQIQGSVLAAEPVRILSGPTVAGLLLLAVRNLLLAGTTAALALALWSNCRPGVGQRRPETLQHVYVGERQGSPLT